MAASGGEEERYGLGQFVKSQTKYGTTTKSTYTNDTYVKYYVQPGETIQGIALKNGVTVEQIKRANNMWTNDSLYLREFLLIPLDKHTAESLMHTQMTNGGTSQPSTSSDMGSGSTVELVTRQDLLHHAKSTNNKGTQNNDSDAKHKQSGDSINFKDFLSKMDSSLAQIKNKAKHLDQSSQFPEDHNNPLNLLPRKTSRISRRPNSWRSVDNEAYDLSSEPELTFSSRHSAHNLQSPFENNQYDNMFQL